MSQEIKRAREPGDVLHIGNLEFALEEDGQLHIYSHTASCEPIWVTSFFLTTDELGGLGAWLCAHAEHLTGGEV